jgi:FtsH-binding integral membrane protein
MTGTPYSPGTPLSASQLGVRPAPELVQRLLVGAFGWMFAGLLLSAGVAYLVGASESLLNWVLNAWLFILIGQVVLGIGIQLAIRKISPTVSLLLFFVYAASMGLTIGVIVWMTMQQAGGTQAVASAFFSAAGMFGAAAVYGAVTKRDLAGLGGILFMALIGIIIASVVNIFLGSEMIGWIISIGGVVLFTALTAYDVQRITRGDYAAWTGSMERASILAALHLYLNFINLFLFLLRIFGGSRN